ncbi:MAG: phage major capsid protein [Nitrospirae bacterium]|nr:phage major capsid protein [Nitrospirota bacterium]
MDILTRAQLKRIGELCLSASQGSNEFSKFSLATAIRDMQHNRLNGYELEVLEEWSSRENRSFDKNRVFIPFSEFRDLSKGTASAGGYLVATETPEAVDILRPWSVTARAGITVETGLIGDQAIPKTTTKATPYWVNETGQVTASNPSLTQVAMTPKTCGALVNVSRQLTLQTNAEGFIRRELMRTIGTAVDQGVLNGSGASGQPLGLLNTTGINTETGTSLAQAGVVSMKRKVSDSNAMDEDISFISTPSIRELLEKRERSTGSGFMWDRDMVASRPAYASTDVPTATMICGAWPYIYLGIWGNGFVVEINPYDNTGFKTGMIQARLLLSMDVSVLHPAAFCVATSIT